MEARRLSGDRDHWAGLPDAALLADCNVDTYRASGPGGQKRNKTSSAVRLRHRPSGLIVIAEESRSQHENRARALKRLRRAMWTQMRDAVDRDTLAGDARMMAVRDSAGRLGARTKQVTYWPAAALALDVFDAAHAVARDAAAALGTTTANFINFLQADVHIWQAANEMRARYGRSPLSA